MAVPLEHPKLYFRYVHAANIKPTQSLAEYIFRIEFDTGTVVDFTVQKIRYNFGYKTTVCAMDKYHSKEVYDKKEPCAQIGFFGASPSKYTYDIWGTEKPEFSIYKNGCLILPYNGTFDIIDENNYNSISSDMDENVKSPNYSKMYKVTWQCSTTHPVEYNVSTGSYVSTTKYNSTTKPSITTCSHNTVPDEYVFLTNDTHMCYLISNVVIQQHIIQIDPVSDENTIKWRVYQHFYNYLMLENNDNNVAIDINVTLFSQTNDVFHDRYPIDKELVPDLKSMGEYLVMSRQEKQSHNISCKIYRILGYTPIIPNISNILGEYNYIIPALTLNEIISFHTRAGGFDSTNNKHLEFVKKRVKSLLKIILKLPPTHNFNDEENTEIDKCINKRIDISSGRRRDNRDNRDSSGRSRDNRDNRDRRRERDNRRERERERDNRERNRSPRRSPRRAGGATLKRKRKTLKRKRKTCKLYKNKF